MKYLRSINELFNDNEPKVGDYVVIKFTDEKSISHSHLSVKPVLENSIGRIEKIHTYSYFIKFGSTTWNINKDDVYAFSANREDLEFYINANKYNL